MCSRILRNCRGTRVQKNTSLRVHALTNHFLGRSALSKITFLEVRALKNHDFGRSARSKHIFLDYTFFHVRFLTDYTDFLNFTGSLDVLDSTDSIEVTDSMDIIDSIDSILVPHKETANIHTTHKGRTKVPMGRSPIGTFVRARAARAPLCVV